jgi:hypothetical protein
MPFLILSTWSVMTIFSDGDLSFRLSLSLLWGVTLGVVLLPDTFLSIALAISLLASFFQDIV